MRGERQTFTCSVCGIGFSLPNWRCREGRGSCCSRQCMLVKFKSGRVQVDAAKRVHRPCGYCKAKISVAPVRARAAAVFCNNACIKQYWASLSTEKACEWCGSTFTVLGSQVAAKGHATAGRFCSRSCAGSHCVRFKQQRVSGTEKQFLDAIEASGLTVIRQHKILTFSVDGFIPEHGAIVEFDGKYWHESAKASARDEMKDAKFSLLGYRVIRVHDTAFKKSPAKTVRSAISQIKSSQNPLFVM